MATQARRLLLLLAAALALGAVALVAAQEASGPTAVALSQVVVTVVDGTAEAATTTKQSAKYPQPLSKPVALDPNDAVTIGFQVVDQADATHKLTPDQTVVRFYNAKKEEISFAATAATAAGYAVELSVSRDADAFLWKSGQYTVEILIGDATVTPLAWTLGTFDIVFPTVAEAEKPSIYEPLPLFEHVFRPADPRPNVFTSLVFTVVVVTPWLVLFGLWGRLGANVRNFPPEGASLSAIVFHGSVAAIFGVLFWYFVSLTIFEAAAYLSVLAVVALFSGKATLSAIAAKRK